MGTYSKDLSKRLRGKPVKPASHRIRVQDPNKADFYIGMATLVKLGYVEIIGKDRSRRTDKLHDGEPTDAEKAEIKRVEQEFVARPGSALEFLRNLGADVNDDADGYVDVTEYTVSRQRVVYHRRTGEEDMYPTRTYRVGDRVWDLLTEQEATILNIQVAQIERLRNGEAEVLFFTDAPPDPRTGPMHAIDGPRLTSEICLLSEIDKYRGSTWIPATQPLDGDFVNGVDETLNESGRAEAKRRGIDPDAPDALEKLMLELNRERGEAKYRQLN